MRKTINVLTMLFAIFSMAGCSESEPEVVPQAFLSADRLIFDQTASEKPVAVTLVGELAVSSVESSAEDWCTAGISADAIVVKVSANDTEASRSADVVVKFDSEVVLPMTIKVAQESGEVPYLKATASESFEFGCRGGEYKFSVSSSAEWKAELVDCGWATLSTDASSVTIEAPAMMEMRCFPARLRLLPARLLLNMHSRRPLLRRTNILRSWANMTSMPKSGIKLPGMLQTKDGAVHLVKAVL